MRAARLLASLAIMAGLASVAHAQTGCARLSWNSCDSWNQHSCWQGPGSYRLVLSVAGLGTPNIGTDFNIRLRLNTSCGFTGYPDAWRFDDAGCQTGSRLGLSSDALNPSCPALKGSSTQSFTNFSIEQSQEAANLRLAIIYDSVTPDPATRYTLWTITFDHSHSIEGASPPDHSSCGGAEECIFFLVDTAILLATSGVPLNFTGCDVNLYPPAPAAVWGECFVCGPSDPAILAGVSDCAPVPTRSSTWGRVRATYR